MRQFDETNLEPWAGGNRISCNLKNLVHSPLPWQKQGLQETASGYGKKLTTVWKIHYCGKLHRIYCCCFSNNGTAYILSHGERIVITAF